MAKVSYDQSLREKAKAEKLCLFTISTSWPGGKEAFTMQGPASVKKIKKIQAFMRKLITEWKSL